jgi:uncharacterized membrane protein (DUF485 family)
MRPRNAVSILTFFTGFRRNRYSGKDHRREFGLCDGWFSILTVDTLMQHKQADSDNSDLTPLAGAPTDVAPLGHGRPEPAHELTADEDADVADWDRVAAMDEFKRLVAAKRRFIIPATIFFIVYYFALPVLVGYAPKLMERRVFGVVNLAYLFALSQFFMAWLIAALYVRAAGRFDEMARSIINRLSKGGKN